MVDDVNTWNQRVFLRVRAHLTWSSWGFCIQNLKRCQKPSPFFHSFSSPSSETVLKLTGLVCAFHITQIPTCYTWAQRWAGQMGRGSECHWRSFWRWSGLQRSEPVRVYEWIFCKTKEEGVTVVDAAGDSFSFVCCQRSRMFFGGWGSFLFLLLAFSNYVFPSTPEEEGETSNL